MIREQGDGFFETFKPVPGDGFGGTTNRHSIALIYEQHNFDGGKLVRTWIFIDVDGNGDFDLVSDMAIAITGSA